MEVWLLAFTADLYRASKYTPIWYEAQASLALIVESERCANTAQPWGKVVAVACHRQYSPNGTGAWQNLAHAGVSIEDLRFGASAHSPLVPMLRLDVGELLDAIVQQLNTWQPRVLATYASMAGILADEQTSGHLQIAPQRIVSSAEVLSPALRQRIQAVWGDIVYDQYGATEGGTFAVECTSPYRASSDADGHTRGLHLFEDLYILEVVDEQNHPVPPGQYGDKVLLTVLFNHTLPLIRYELSDRMRMSTMPCSCGCAFSLISDIQGRGEDVLRFPGRDGGTVAVHPMVFYRILDAIPVSGWQVVQEREMLSLRLSDGAQRIQEQALVNTVRDALERLNAVAPAITVKWMRGVERGATGKAARIVSHP